MNERFENLAEAAMVHVPGSTGLHSRIFSLEKFAELIVKECLHIVDDEGAGEGGCIRAMIRIQDEFGVEQ